MADMSFVVWVSGAGKCKQAFSELQIISRNTSALYFITMESSQFAWNSSVPSRNEAHATAKSEAVLCYSVCKYLFNILILQIHDELNKKYNKKWVDEENELKKKFKKKQVDKKWV